MNQIIKRNFSIIISILLITLISCSEKFDKIEENRFEGRWTMEGRSISKDLQIEIKNENGKLIGRLIKLNENKYVKFFCDSNDVWISEIKRNSNFQFSLKEKKIGNELFSIYGLETSKEYKVEFIDENTFGLISNNEDPLKSKIKYRRIE